MIANINDKIKPKYFENLDSLSYKLISKTVLLINLSSFSSFNRKFNNYVSEKCIIKFAIEIFLRSFKFYHLVIKIMKIYQNLNNKLFGKKTPTFSIFEGPPSLFWYSTSLKVRMKWYGRL